MHLARRPGAATGARCSAAARACYSTAAGARTAPPSRARLLARGGAAGLGASALACALWPHSDGATPDGLLLLRDASRALAAQLRSAQQRLASLSATGADDGLGAALRGAWRGEAIPDSLPRRSSSGGGGSPATPAASAGQRAVLQLAAVNAGVYACWWLLPEAFMHTWFTTSAQHMLRGPHGLLTALTASFSHREWWHMGLNMMALVSFGPRLVDGRSTVQAPKLSTNEFLGVYVASGYFAALCSNAFSVFARSSVPSLGASGSLFALLSYYTLSYPDSRIYFMFVFDLNAMTALWASTALNGWLVFKAYRAARLGVPGPMFDGMAHLGGAAAGVLAYQWARRREEGRRRAAGPDGWWQAPRRELQ